MASKVKKTLIGLLAIVLGLVIVLLCIFFFWLGPTVKMVAQNIGSKALGTPLTISELRINPRHGTFHMSGFAVANPNDFGRTQAVSLESVDLSLDVGSIFSPTVLVHRIQIESPHFVYEQNLATDNISQFLKNLEAYMGGEAPEKPQPRQDEPSDPKAIVIEQLEINDIQFHLANTADPTLDIEAYIDQLAVSMTNGVVQLKSFRISNPEHLATPNLFTLDAVTVEVDPATIYTEPLSVLDVQVVRPYAYLERNSMTDTVKEFIKITERLAKSEAGGLEEKETVEEPPVAETDQPTGREPLHLHNLLIDDIQVKLLDTTATTNAEPCMLAGIGSISVKLVNGHIRIQGIRIPNPAGYASTNLFQLAAIDIAADPATLFTSQVGIQKVLINSPQINLEQTEDSGNVVELQEKLMGFAPPARTDSGAPSPEAVSSTGPRPEPVPLSAQPVVVHALVVTNFAVNLKLPVVTNEPSWSVSMTDLASLNPLKKLPLEKLNPVDRLKLDKIGILGGGEEEEPEADPDAPMKLVAFKNLSIQPLKGVIDIDKFRVANPPGFTRRSLARLDALHCELDPDSLPSDTLLIKDIIISAPHVRYERQIMSDNIKALQKAIEKATVKGEEPKEDATESEEPQADEPSGQKVVIGRVLITGSTVQAKLSALPATPPIPLPKIELHDIGKKEGGATAAEASAKVFDTFYDTMISTVGETTGFAGDMLKGAGSLALAPLGKDGEDATEAQEAEPEQPKATDELKDSTKTKRRRTLFNRRRPGRTF